MKPHHDHAIIQANGRAIIRVLRPAGRPRWCVCIGVLELPHKTQADALREAVTMAYRHIFCPGRLAQVVLARQGWAHPLGAHIPTQQRPEAEQGMSSDKRCTLCGAAGHRASHCPWASRGCPGPARLVSPLSRSQPALRRLNASKSLILLAR